MPVRWAAWSPAPGCWTGRRSEHGRLAGDAADPDETRGVAVVFPQAIRVILPPLGNDFIAMVKDSSLVSVLGVADITQMGKVYASGSFRFFETYSIVAYTYLLLTVSLSLCLRGLEHRLRRKGRE